MEIEDERGENIIINFDNIISIKKDQSQNMLIE